MTAAFQPPRTASARPGGSRFFASPPRAPRRRHARPANRLAGQKTAPGIFFAAPPKTHPETVTQVTNPHQESATYVFVFVSGCAVAPNSGNGYFVVGGSFGGTNLVPLGRVAYGLGASAGISLITNAKPGGTYLQLSFSVTPLVGHGQTVNSGFGAFGGMTSGAPKTGFTYDQSNHVEFGGGAGDTVVVSTDFNSDGATVSPPFSLRGIRDGPGEGGYQAGGRSNNISLTIPLPVTYPNDPRTNEPTTMPFWYF